jgi:hypothetical protein
MAVKLMSTNDNPQLSPSGRFFMTPDQHRRQAALLRKAGNGVQAKQCEMLASAIEKRLLSRT